MSASGVVPLSRQLDHVGPLAASVADAWLLYNAMLPASDQIADALEPAPIKGLRLGVLTGYFLDRLDADVEKSVLETLERLLRRGAVATEVTVPHAADLAAILHLVFGDAAEYHAHAGHAAAGLHEAGPAAARDARYVLAELHPRAARQGADHARDRSRPRRRRCARAAGAGHSGAAPRRNDDAREGRNG